MFVLQAAKSTFLSYRYTFLCTTSSVSSTVDFTIPNRYRFSVKGKNQKLLITLNVHMYVNSTLNLLVKTMSIWCQRKESQIILIILDVHLHVKTTSILLYQIDVDLMSKRRIIDYTDSVSQTNFGRLPVCKQEPLKVLNKPERVLRTYHWEGAPPKLTNVFQGLANIVELTS